MKDRGEVSFVLGIQRSFSRFDMKEIVRNKQISIEHMGTSFMLSDSLTRGLIPKVFHENTAHMGVAPYDTLVQ
ncbi:hypothetical protein CR513_02713, partial [Mucuna pruriens]